MSFYKKNINVENYFIRAEFVVFQTDKASFINFVVYHIHFRDCNKTRKNNKIYNLKYKNIIKNNTYINKNYKIDTLKNSLNKTL